MSKYTRDIAKAMKWGKWPFLIIFLIAAIINVAIKAESNSTIGSMIGYYFKIIFSFTLISMGFCCFYQSLIFERISTNYPDRFQQLRFPTTPLGLLQFFKLSKSLGDNTLNRWCKRGLFWFFGTLSIFVTAPVGMIVSMILQRPSG